MSHLLLWPHRVLKFRFLETKRETLKRKKSKISQKIVLFIEPNEFAWQTPLKIGNLFINRFAVDEDAASEVLKIFELEKYPMSFDEEYRQKGMDLIIIIDHEFVWWVWTGTNNMKHNLYVGWIPNNDHILEMHQKQFFSGDFGL